MELEHIFTRLWEIYTAQNPAVQKVYDLFTLDGEIVRNDHIAFRTFDDPRVNIEVLARVFKKAGYVEKGQYRFEEKKLFAKHYEHQGIQDADNDDARASGEPHTYAGERRLPQRGTQAEEERCKAQVGNEPAR